VRLTGYIAIQNRELKFGEYVRFGDFFVPTVGAF